MLGTYFWCVPWAHGTALLFHTQGFAPFTDKTLVDQGNTTFQTLYTRGIIHQIFAQYIMEVAALARH